jgi:hypothetical protein
MISRRHPGLRITLLLASLAALSAACGGKVVVESSGAAGSGGAGGAPDTAVTVGIGSAAAQSGVGGAGGCTGLQADVTATLAAAQACNPALSVPQCSGTNTAVDTCGCPVVANDAAVEAAQLANMAFKTWVSAGCGPFNCFSCPPPPTSPWFCDPTAAVCKPAFQK